MTFTHQKILFTVLYFVQGGAVSYFTLFQKPYLVSLDIDRAKIGLLSSLILLPFVIKFMFGLLSDKLPLGKWGKRKPYMVFALSMSALAFFICGFNPADVNFIAYAMFMVLASLMVAFFDAVTDGYAVDSVAESEYGTIQSYMVGGKAAGVILLSMAIGHFSAIYGFSSVFIFFSLLMLLPLLLTMIWVPTSGSTSRHAPTDVSASSGVSTSKIDSASNRSPSGHYLKNDSFKPTIFWLVAAIGFTYSIVSFGTDGLITIYLSEAHNLAKDQIGTYGATRGIGTLLGAALAAVLLKRFKNQSIYLTGLVAVLLGNIVVGQSINASNYHSIGIIWGLCFGTQEVLFLTLMMSVVPKSASAFGFAVLATLCNLGTAVAEGVFTTMTSTWSYPALFLLIGSLICVPALLMAFVIYLRSKLPH